MLCVLLVSAGCGTQGRFDVTGSVTFNGKPVPAGTVTFVPMGSPAGRVAGFCSIRDGRYATRKGRSPGSGPHLAIVDGYDGVAFERRVGDLIEDHPLGSPLFPSHSIDVDLPAKHGTVLDFAIPTP